MSRPGNRDQRSVVGHAVLEFRLRRRHLVVRGQRQLAVRQREDGIGAPVHRIGRAATGLSAAAPLVREQDLGAGVVEVGGMPEGVVRIADGVDADGIHGVGDVQQDSIAGTRPGGQPDGRIDRDVVALVGARRGLRAFAVVAALPEAVHGSGLRIGEDARAGYDLRLLRMRQRHLDDVDAEQRGVGIGRRDRRPSSPPVLPPDERRRCRRYRCRRCPCLWGRSRSVCVCEPRQLCTAATCFGFARSLISKMRTPRNRSGLGGGGGRRARSGVPLRGRRAPGAAAGAGHSRPAGDSLGAAVDPSIDRLRRHEEQMAVHRDVALAAGADQGSPQLDLRRVVDVVEIDAVVVADEKMVAAEGQIRVGGAVLSGEEAPEAVPRPAAGGWRRSRSADAYRRGRSRAASAEWRAAPCRTPLHRRRTVRPSVRRADRRMTRADWRRP